MKAPLEFSLSPLSLCRPGSSPASSFGHAELGITSIVHTVSEVCADRLMIVTVLTQSAGSHREDSDHRMILLDTEWLGKSDIVSTLLQFSQLSSERNLVFFDY